MKVTILGAAGFIGTNLALHFLNTNDEITLVDEKDEYFFNMPLMENAKRISVEFDAANVDFDEIVRDQDFVYHLISTNNPTTSNKNIGRDLTDNIMITIKLLEACVKNHVKRVIFISSGGTVYGPDANCPIKEDDETNPINTYGIQKLTIEKLFYLYEYMHGLDYRVVRLSNPYGPYQRPNGKLGVITTFIYRALNDQTISVYGDGSVIRDYIYIEDAINGIIMIAACETEQKIYNLGSGVGTSVNDVIEIIKKITGRKLDVKYIEKRSVDVPVNILDVSKFRAIGGDKIVNVSLEDGIKKTIQFFENNMQLYT